MLRAAPPFDNGCINPGCTLTRFDHHCFAGNKDNDYTFGFGTLRPIPQAVRRDPLGGVDPWCKSWHYFLPRAAAAQHGGKLFLNSSHRLVS